MSKVSRNDSTMAWDGCPKNFKLLKYEHIVYHFKARDLEILLILIFRQIFKFREIRTKQISRNFLKCS